VPSAFHLEQNYPNPFNPVTTLRFTLSLPVTAQLNVYDITGRLVTQLIHQPMGAGTFEVTWDGRNAQGQIVPTGVYFARLEAGTFRQTRIMLLVK
jgi:flagellar hook assembly protein FlgD